MHFICRLLSKEYTPQKYIQHFVLNYFQNEQLRLNGPLVQRRKNKSRYVTKKSIRDEIIKAVNIDKEWLAKFTVDHPEVFQNFKKKTKAKIKAVHNSEIVISSLAELCVFLIERLKEIPVGKGNATEYHRVMVGIMELLFYPSLCSPTVEREIHDGRKRIDITFDNCAENGFFFRLHTTHGIPSSFVMVECKNYSRDIANPELDQISGRFSPNRGQAGIVVCRSIDDMELFICRCRDTYKDLRGLIIPIVDNDIIQLLSFYDEMENRVVDDFLQNRFRSIALS